MEAYISTPIKLEKLSRVVQKALEGIGIKVNNPCDIEGTHGNPAEFPIRVANECIDMMNRSDIGVLLLDYFGHDCASEVGYMGAKKIPIYGVYVDRASASNESFESLKQYQYIITKVFDSVDELVEFLSK